MAGHRHVCIDPSCMSDSDHMCHDPYCKGMPPPAPPSPPKLWVSTDRYGHEQMGVMTFGQRLRYRIAHGRWPWKPAAL